MTKTELNKLAKEFYELNAKQKETEARLKSLKALITKEMKDETTITLKDFVVNITKQIRTNADLDRLKADKLYDKYSKESVVSYFKVLSR